MSGIVLGVAIGCFIGWNFPQPAYAKAAQTYIMGLFQKK